MEDTLFVIPARKGSKRLPGKNIKPLGGKPLIGYTIEEVRAVAPKDNIVVSTDGDEIAGVARQYGLQVPYMRPASLARDHTASREVLLHALDYFEQQGRHFGRVVLLQPTSPFRRAKHIQEACDLYHDGLDMVVSVRKAGTNPYTTMYRETDHGYLKSVVPSAGYLTRHQTPAVWEYNGAVYVMNSESLKSKDHHFFDKKKKYVMDELNSVDIDTELDFAFAEFLLTNEYIVN